MPVNAHRFANALAAAVVLTCLVAPAAAFADADAIYAEADAAFKAADYKKAAKDASRGIELSREARFLYLRARAVWQLGDYEEAWSLMNLVKPNELPAEQQEPFVADYARMEVEAKAQREKKAASLKSGPPKPADGSGGSGLATWLLVGGGAGLAAGGVLMAYGYTSATEIDDQVYEDPSVHPDYHDRYGSARTLYWTGVGLMAAGAAVAAWGALEMWGGEPQAAGPGVTLRPGTWPSPSGATPLTGLTLDWRF